MAIEVWIHSFLNLGTRVKSMFDFTFRPLYPQERMQVPIQGRRLGCPRADVGVLEKRKFLYCCQNLNPRSSNP